MRGLRERLATTSGTSLQLPSGVTDVLYGAFGLPLSRRRPLVERPAATEIVPLGDDEGAPIYDARGYATQVCGGSQVFAFSLGVADVRFLATVTTACAKRTGAAASVERRRREPDRAISPE